MSFWGPFEAIKPMVDFQMGGSQEQTLHSAPVNHNYKWPYPKSDRWYHNEIPAIPLDERYNDFCIRLAKATEKKDGN